MLKKIKENALRETGTAISTQIENDLRLCFYRTKTDIWEGNPTTLYAKRRGNQPFFVQLTWDHTLQAWVRAYHPTITLVHEQLKKLKDLKKDHEVVKIIVSGGSSRHRIFRDFLDGACKALEVGIEPFYMNRIGRANE